jgi:hypothetical protein
MIRAKMAKTKGSILAWAGPRIRHPKSQRPISGEMAVTWYGDKTFLVATDSVDLAVGTLIHELGHVIAFMGFQKYHSRYTRYNKTHHLFQWTGPKVAQAGSKFYGCEQKDWPGMSIETINSSKAGSHWTEEWTGPEMMSPVSGSLHQLVSPVTLALVEDTDWYKVDHRFSENYTFRKGQGCAIKYNCPKTPICTIGTENIAVSDHKGIGYCKKDKNGCAVENKYGNRNCTAPGGWEKYFLDYGASYDGNCVIAQGSFARYDADKQAYAEKIVSVRADCAKDHSSYKLTWKNFKLNLEALTHSGDVSVVCDKEGDTRFNVNGDTGSYVKCKDPKSFCEARFGHHSRAGGEEGACDDSCKKNGRCHPGEAKAVTSRLTVGDSLLDRHRNRFIRLRMGPRRILRTKRLAWSWAGWCSYSEMNRKFKKIYRVDLEVYGGPAKLQKYIDPNTNSPKCIALRNKKDAGPAFPAHDGQWKCWCYKDQTEHATCPNLQQDRD